MYFLKKLFSRKAKVPPCDHTRSHNNKILPVTMTAVAGSGTLLLHILPLFRWEGPCAKCGENYATEGLLDRKTSVEYGVTFNENGWPLNADGQKLPTHGEWEMIRAARGLSPPFNGRS